MARFTRVEPKEPVITTITVRCASMGGFTLAFAALERRASDQGVRPKPEGARPVTTQRSSLVANAQQRTTARRANESLRRARYGVKFYEYQRNAPQRCGQRDRERRVPTNGDNHGRTPTAHQHHRLHERRDETRGGAEVDEEILRTKRTANAAPGKQRGVPRHSTPAGFVLAPARFRRSAGLRCRVPPRATPHPRLAWERRGPGPRLP